MSLFIDQKTGKMSQAQESGMVALTDETSRATDQPAPLENSVSRYSVSDIFGNNEASKFYNGLDREFTAADEQKIKDEERANRQGLLDNINSTYVIKQQEEMKAGEGRAGSTRAFSARSGTLGMDFGNADAEKTQDYNKQKLNLIQQERLLKLNEVIGKFDQRAQDRIEAEKAKVLGNQDKYLNYLKESSATAREDVRSLASSGMDIKDFTKDEYDEMLKQTGYSPLVFDSIYNSNKPKAAQVKYTYLQLRDGTLSALGDDGSFKNMGNYAPPDETSNWQIESVGGMPYWTKKDEAGNIIDFKNVDKNDKEGFSLGQGQARYEYSATTGQYERVGYNPKASSGNSSNTNKKQVEDDTKEMTTELGSVVGSDGFVSPDNYAFAKKKWIETGYSPSDFDDSFAGFRNPSNKNYSMGGEKAESNYDEEQAAIEKQKQVAAAAAEKDAQDKESKSMTGQLKSKQSQGLTKSEVEKWLKKEYGSVPKSAKTWIKENYK